MPADLLEQRPGSFDFCCLREWSMVAALHVQNRAWESCGKLASREAKVSRPRAASQEHLDQHLSWALASKSLVGIWYTTEFPDFAQQKMERRLGQDRYGLKHASYRTRYFDKVHHDEDWAHDRHTQRGSHSSQTPRDRGSY